MTHKESRASKPIDSRVDDITRLRGAEEGTCELLLLGCYKETRSSHPFEREAMS